MIVTLHSSDGMMQRMDEIESRREVQHQLIYMQDGAVILDIYQTLMELLVNYEW